MASIRVMVSASKRKPPRKKMMFEFRLDRS
jgi:hypothetical protein